MLSKIQSIINKYGFAVSTKSIASEVYWELKALGFSPCIVNDRYIEVDGVMYQLLKTRAKGHWTAKEI